MNYIAKGGFVMGGNTAGGASNSSYTDARIKTTHRVVAGFTGNPGQGCNLIATCAAGVVNFDIRSDSTGLSIMVTPGIQFEVFAP